MFKINESSTLIELAQATHLLIAGTTGSGKSVLINGIIYTLINAYTPQQIDLILIDPKKIELAKYKDLPHCRHYANTTTDIIDTLKQVCGIMDSTYSKMSASGTTSCYFKPIYIIVDELADLMTTSKKECAPLLQRIAQLGRAANIHLFCATQAPNRKVLPPELVLNFTHRVALRCLSPIESRQIIGVKGAEDLPMYGTGIYQSPNYRTHVYIDIPYIPNSTIINRVSQIKQTYPKKHTIFKKAWYK